MKDFQKCVEHPSYFPVTGRIEVRDNYIQFYTFDFWFVFSTFLMIFAIYFLTKEKLKNYAKKKNI